MNKSDLVQALSTKSDLSKAQALKAIEALFSTDDGLIIDALKRGEKVQISGFGTFETKQRKARTGRNPRTGEHVSVAQKSVPFFKTGKEMRERLNKSPVT